MQDQIRAAIAEHEQSITKARELAQGYQEKLQTLAVDVERRQGAIMALRQLLSAEPVPVPAADLPESAERAP